MLKKIEKVRTSIPLDKTEPEQMWINEWGNQLFVRSENTDGIVGWGEILTAAGNSRAPYEAMLDILIEQILTSDEDNIRELWNKMRRLSFSGGYGITTGSISGIDISLWDLFSRKVGSSLSNILGKGGLLLKDMLHYPDIPTRRRLHLQLRNFSLTVISQ